MRLDIIRSRLVSSDIFYADNPLATHPSIAGYDKQFRWSWIATQLNCFFIATQVEAPLSVEKMEALLQEAFRFSEKHYSGWPRGLQSGVGVVLIVISSAPNAEVQDYCLKLKSGRKWAGFTVPVVIDKETSEVYKFDHKPLWGRIYYPYFENMIKTLCAS